MLMQRKVELHGAAALLHCLEAVLLLDELRMRSSLLLELVLAKEVRRYGSSEKEKVCCSPP